MKADQFIEQARTWIGTPFRHQGRNRLGVDCIGYPIVLLRENGILPSTFKDNVNYGHVPLTPVFLQTVQENCIQLEKIEHGCLLVIKWPGAKFPHHAALIDGVKMIHAYETAKNVVTHGYQEPWKRLTHSFYRLPGIQI